MRLKILRKHLKKDDWNIKSGDHIDRVIPNHLLNIGKNVILVKLQLLNGFVIN